MTSNWGKSLKKNCSANTSRASAWFVLGKSEKTLVTNSFYICNVNHLAEYIIEVGQCLDCLNRRPVSYYNLDISF